MNLKHIFLLAASGVLLSAEAHTVLLSENFNEDYTTNFPVMIEGDHLHPVQRLQSLFMDAQGVMRPWRMLKDVSTSEDGFLASHSCYSPAGKSNDWLVSTPLKINGNGFELTFDAQSIAFHSPARASKLWIYVTETPVTSEDNLPAGEATWVIDELPFGEDPDNTAGDFTHYKFSLDEWVGKTVYISFANLNEDRDILAIDNVIVQRLDPAQITVEEIPLAVAGDYELKANIAGTMNPGLKNWTLTAKFTNGQEFTASGETLAVDETKDFEIPFTVTPDEHLGYVLTLSSDDAEPIIVEGEVRGLAFEPKHRVLMEESTGLWCGNCPMGQFTIESMMLDPEMNEKVVPVSVHVPSSSHANYLVVEDYATPLGMTVAPAFRLDREFKAKTFSQVHDTKYDPSNEESVAGTIRKLASRLTIMDIDVTGEFHMVAGDTVGINVKATVTPAYTIDDNSEYALGFVLTENNVWLANHASWSQTNYLSGYDQLGSDVGGWVNLPKVVANVRLQDVARAIVGYRGIDNSLPKDMKMSEDYEYTTYLEIPYTRIIEDGVLQSPEVVAANCGIVAYIIERATNTVVNSAYYPMTEQTEKRFTIKDLINTLAVDEIGSDDVNAPVEYFTIDGLRVANPQEGQLYIVRQGSKTKKIIY